jgi:hypothetical protein
MRNRSMVRARRSLAAGAAALVGVVVAPAPAGADDGAQSVLPGVTLPTVSDAVAAGEAAIADGAVDELVDDVLGETADATETAPPATQAPEHETAAETPDLPSAPEGNQAESGSRAHDTVASAPDTTGDTPSDDDGETSTPTASVTGATTPSGAVARQVAPTNVNVNIRIASPGDNGSVTQANVAIGAGAVGAARTESSAQAQAASAATPSTTGAAPVSPSASSAISPGADDSGVWNWQWDCLSIPSFVGWYPGGSEGGIAPSSWIWNWNCGDNAQQYQTGTLDQYRPVNVNVGIRIASPGNDGPVNQTNIVVAFGVGGSHVSAAVSAVTGSAVPDESPRAAESELHVDSVAAPEGMSAGLASAETSVAAPPTLEDNVDPSRGGVGLLGPLPPAGLSGSATGRSGLLPTRLGAAGGRGLVILEPVTIRPSSLPGGEASGRGSSRGHAKEAQKVAHWRPAVPGRGGITRVSSGTSAAPASASGASSGGLPLVLALPFLVAVLDMARRIALDRVATPSGHRSRVPDDPG